LRPVLLNGAGKALLFLAGILLTGGIVAGFLLDRTSRRQTKEADLLAGQGVRTQAQIVRVWEVGERRGKKSNSRFRVTYTFEHAGGRYTRSMRVPRNKVQTLTEGGHVAVLYLPTQPEISHPVDWEERPDGPPNG